MTGNVRKHSLLRRTLGAILLLLLTAVCLPAQAQRRVTPVQPSAPGTAPRPEREQKIDLTKLVKQLDADGNTIYVDTVTGTEVKDTTMLATPPKMEYPLLHSLTAGVNLWNPIMRAFGQHYGLGDVWAELSLHNRYFPFVALGVDNCSDTPDASNFHFRTPVSPYFKIGASYNFLYNSNPDYKFQIGMRYGFTAFKWSVDNISLDNSYWGEDNSFSIPSQSAHAGYFELVAGLKVRIAGNWSLGWNLVYHSIMHESKSDYGQTMFIPGFGKRGQTFTGNFSVMYTLPINKKKAPEVNIETTGEQE